MVVPSNGTSRPSASRISTSTPGVGSPAWVRTRLVTSSSSQPCIACLGQATLASGEVSVIPQAWTRLRPNSRRYRSISARGGWLPPQMMCRSAGSRRGCAASSSATASHTVGTPAVTVTRSSAHASTSAAGLSGPARKTCLAPTATAACGIPQALT
jgi:hypothetical protein